MTPRRRAILIVALIVALIAVVVAMALLLRRAAPEIQAPTEVPVDTTPEVPTPAAPSAAAAIQDPLAPKPTAVPAGSTASVQVAELFAERYGSYSSQGDFQNLRDLLPVMTTKFRSETEAYLAATKPSTGEFQGVTSTKVSSETRTFDDAAGRAVVAVTLQQEKSVGSAAPTVGYRTLRMALLKSGSDWKVDSAVWED